MNRTLFTIFQLKDAFTCASIGCAALSLANLANDSFSLAYLLFILGVVLDILDGAIARWSNSANEFGRLFDMVGDLGLYTYVPALALYVELHELAPYMAAIASVSLVITGNLRVAGNESLKNYLGEYRSGLARAIVAIFIIGFLGSSVREWLFGFSWGILAFFSAIVILLFLILIPIPYPKHTNVPRKLLTVIGLIVSASVFYGFWAFARGDEMILFNILLIWSTGWILLGPLGVVINVKTMQAS